MSHILLPKQFEFLNDVGPLPKMVEEGLKFLGLHEIPGPKSNAIILSMAKDLGIDDIYTNDDVSWCALFITWLCWKTGKPLPYKNYEMLRALSYAGKGPTNPKPWGDHVPLGQQACGDLAVLQRSAGGHIAIFIGQTIKGTAWLLGGNQSNQVSFSEFGYNRIIDFRRYYSIAKPASAKLYLINGTGKLSTNEA